MLFSGKIPFHVAARLTPRFWVPHLLQFATIPPYSRLFALFETVRTIRTIRYSGLFTVRYSRLFAIRYSGFPDTQFYLLYSKIHKMALFKMCEITQGSVFSVLFVCLFACV